MYRKLYYVIGIWFEISQRKPQQIISMCFPPGWLRWWTPWSQVPRTSVGVEQQQIRTQYPSRCVCVCERVCACVCLEYFKPDLFYWSRKRTVSSESQGWWARVKCGLMRLRSLVGLGPAVSKCYVSYPAELKGQVSYCILLCNLFSKHHASSLCEV